MRYTFRTMGKYVETYVRTEDLRGAHSTFRLGALATFKHEMARRMNRERDITINT